MSNFICACGETEKGGLAYVLACLLFWTGSWRPVVAFGGQRDNETKEPNVLTAILPPKSDQPKLPVTFPRSVSRKPFLKEGAIKKFGLHSFMGLRIGMLIGETVRINPVIEEGVGKLTSMAKPSGEI